MTIEDLRGHISKPRVVPELRLEPEPEAEPESEAGREPEPEAPAEGSGVWVNGEAFDAVGCLERIRWLVEELGRSQRHVDDTHCLVDEIHQHLDALKRHRA